MCREKKRRCELPIAPEVPQRKRKAEEALSDVNLRGGKRTNEAVKSRGSKGKGKRKSVVPEEMVEEMSKMDDSLHSVQAAVEQSQTHQTLMDTRMGLMEAKLERMEANQVEIKANQVEIKASQVEIKASQGKIVRSQLEMAKMLVAISSKVGIDVQGLSKGWSELNVVVAPIAKGKGKEGKGKDGKESTMDVD